MFSLQPPDDFDPACYNNSMTKTSATIQALEHFRFKNRDKTLKKLQRIVNDGADKLHLIIDFDRTLTVDKSERDGDTTTWQILKARLSPKGLNKYFKLFDKYRPLEIEGKMSQEDAQNWWSKTLQLYIENEINLLEVERKFLEKATIRPQAKDVFRLCETLGIPTVILSAGIKDVIDIWSKTFQIKPTLVLSTKLILDKKGKIIDWENDSLIHVLNKREKGHAKLTAIKEHRLNTILIGDSIDDARMVEGEQNVLRIRLMNPREDENSNEKDFEKDTLEKFDLMIDNNTFEPILKILELIK